MSLAESFSFVTFLFAEKRKVRAFSNLQAKSETWSLGKETTSRYDPAETKSPVS
jgi:hypothetical protein